MGRKKQALPKRAAGNTSVVDVYAGGNNRVGDAIGECSERPVEQDENGSANPRKPFYVDVSQSSGVVGGCYDVAEVGLNNVTYEEGFSDSNLVEEVFQSHGYCLRFHLSCIEEDYLKLGHWPVEPAGNILLEMYTLEPCGSDERRVNLVCSGTFDGPDEGVSGLVHLVSLHLLTLRMILLKGSSLRLRVEFLKKLFDICPSLLDATKNPWKRSMMNVMAWLRPEVITPETKYGIDRMEVHADITNFKMSTDCGSKYQTSFDAATFYEAIKPSKTAPMLEDEFPYLIPQLRPYQRRAVFWMVEKEKQNREVSNDKTLTWLLHPLCVPVDMLDSNSKIFYNPFSGNISLHPEVSSSLVSGGILAGMIRVNFWFAERNLFVYNYDPKNEMGLGKTVELLACIFANPMVSSEDATGFRNESVDAESGETKLKRLKRERVECVCGATTESFKYMGVWVQCDVCDAWQHADCVGFTFNKKRRESPHITPNSSVKSKKYSKRKDRPKINLTNDSYICSLCSELIQASKCYLSGATLIVCPSPILSQWAAEIVRHTKPNSLKIFIYEGVKSQNLSDDLRMDLSKLLSVDIVLTTYEVLREDLAHDFDRHDGDRRAMRFHKRYPVIPTPLTRIHWWRVCLDEAQMVESNAASATEMALRLHAQHRWCITGTPIQRRLDDLYGLVRFLTISPFDIHRWWVDIIRDPYECGDVIGKEFTHQFFKTIMWRSSKVHVSDELQLPAQEEWRSWLTFSQIEAHFYQKQHESCAKFAHELIESLKNGTNNPCHFFLAQHDAAKLLNSLLKLRQACCHPQVGSSGLKSLQKSPMTMEEILQVLVAKAKTEGEEALRLLVVALNGLAGIAAMEQDFVRAVSLYKEALSFTDQHAEDFRLDPLLDLHIHYNLAELVPLSACEHSAHSGPISNDPIGSNQFPVDRERIDFCYPKLDSDEHAADNGLVSSLSGQSLSGRKRPDSLDPKFEHDEHAAHRDLVSNDPSGSDKFSMDSQQLDSYDLKLGHDENSPGTIPDSIISNLDADKGMMHGVQSRESFRLFGDDCLRKACEIIKQKYLSVFISKLLANQQEFRSLHSQVCDELRQNKKDSSPWWLQALDLIEKKDASNDTMKKIDEAVSGSFNGSKSPRISSRFRNLMGLKFLIEKSLDQLASSRQALLDRLMEIDQTMENPRDDDIDRIRNCRNCHNIPEGCLCVHCELDELFQVYEARLFRLSKGGGITSAEEAVDFQKKKFALNRYFGIYSQSNDNSVNSSMGAMDDGRKRDVGKNILISRSPSELEIILSVLRNYTKTLMGKDGVSSANRHLLLFEAMRKEFPLARSLSTAQAQTLCAYDEIKMATSRLRLREADSNSAGVDAFTLEELPAASVQFSSDKFHSLTLLNRIKGQLRYLKGLVILEQKTKLKIQNHGNFTCHSGIADTHFNKNEDDSCPVCQEKLNLQKMVFQCGHITCCRCLVEMMEQTFHNGRGQWVMCPTCRQRTEYENIGFVNDGKTGVCDSVMPSSLEGHNISEVSMAVSGSYGTKIEAVTRRILWIKSADPHAKIIVFSSWNDVLDVMEHAMGANGIRYVRMKGGRKAHAAIMQFKGQKSILEVGKPLNKQPEQEPVQVLLLLIQHGANGLNILEAQHVILVEPLLNPAAEAQAINRVHRIGQEKMTFVHRFLVKGSVEESIYQLNKSRGVHSIISGNTKNQDQPVLTLNDVESLFSPAKDPKKYDETGGSLSHLPPSVAAALAAEKRLAMSSN